MTINLDYLADLQRLHVTLDVTLALADKRPDGGLVLREIEVLRLRHASSLAHELEPRGGQTRA